MSLIETHAANGVMYIALADEPRRNALSRDMLSELFDTIDEVERRDDVRVALVTNRGNVFCAGANLAELSDPEGASGVGTFELSELFQRIRHSPKPFVGRLAGHCIAGGVGLAAVMDISIAIDSAMFGFTEVRVGVAPAMISVVCLAKMRLADAQSAFLRGNRFSASEAARMGLITAASSAERLDDTVTEVLNDLLAGSPVAIAAAKRLTTVVPTLSTDEAFEWTSQLSRDLFAGDEASEGMSAFLEKRPARWVAKISGLD